MKKRRKASPWGDPRIGRLADGTYVYQHPSGLLYSLLAYPRIRRFVAPYRVTPLKR